MTIPIILCGKTEMIGQSVIEALKPEYEVVHFVLSPEAGAEEIAHVLRGETPPTSSSKLGSGNFGSSNTPKAIVTGAAYDVAEIEILLKPLNEVGGAELPVLKADRSVDMPPVGPEYGKKMAERARAGLDILEKESKFGKGGVYLY